MAILSDVLLQGLRAAQPAAATTAEGTLYFVTDEEVTEQVSGGAWTPYSAAAASLGITELTGDVTAGPGSGTQAATIPAGTVTDAMLRDSAALSLIGNPTNAPIAPADIVAGSDGEVMRRSGTAIAFGAVDLASANAVTGTLPNTNIAATSLTRQITITLDGGGAALTTGAQMVYLSIPVSCTITKWRILADQIGDIVLDIWVEDYAGFPPVVGDSITAAAKPSLSGGVQQTNESSSLGTWITALVAGDVMEINIDSTSSAITKLILTLDVLVG